MKTDLAALTLLHDLSTRLLAVDRLEPLLQEIMDAAVAIVEAERGTLQLVEGDSLRIVAHHGHQPPFLKFFAAAENRASVCGEALKRGERVIVADVAHSPLFAGTPSLKVLRDAGVRAVQSAPLLTRQGRLLGILTTQWSVPHVPDEHDLWRIDLLARQAADLIEHKQAEAALKKSEEKYRVLFDSMTEGFGLHEIILDTDGKPCDFRFLELNAAWERLTGVPRATAVGKTVKQVWPELDAYWLETYGKVALTGEPVHYENYSTPLQRWYETFAYSPKQNQFALLFTDVTERKQAEEALRESEERFRIMADGSPNPIWVTNAAGERIFANKQYLEYFGISEREMEGGEWKPFLHPDDAPTYVNSFLSSLKEHRPFSAEARVRRADGQWRWIESHAEPRLSREGEFLGFVGITQDITGRRETEERLRDLNATLESKVGRRTAELQHRAQQLQKLTLELTQAEEKERRRIAVILHEDLQQQIAGAKFHLSLVRNRAQDDRLRTEVDTVDAMLKGAVEKARSLSHDLSPAVMHMNDLAEVLRWLVNRVRAQQGMSVNLNVWGDMMLHSEALATFLFRAAQEMLFNVVKHAHVREADIRVRRIGRYVCLSVSDQGQGFNPEELKKTSGVGLFSIRERTELLRGRIKVQSTLGQGSRFRITVPDGPKVQDGEMTTEDVGYASATISPPSSHGALRVLLVDDHEVVRAGLAALLREAPGIELVGEAPDGREAITRAMDLQPDVVIMDVSMPLMGGAQATRQIKRYLPQTRVIALSMYDDADKKESMFEAGAEGYILKTVSAEDLLAAIRGKPRSW